MRSWLRALRRELGQSLPRLTFLIMAVTMVLLLWVKGASWGGRWNALGFEVREYLILVAPIGVTLAAWQGGRTKRDQTSELLASTRASALSRHSTEIVAIAVSAYGGWLVAVGLAGLSILRLDGWGTTAAAHQILGVAPALFTYVALGYAIGRFLPWRVIAPFAGIATYLLLAIPGYVNESVSVLLGNGSLGDDVYWPFAKLSFWISSIGLSVAGFAFMTLTSIERRPAPSTLTRTAAVGFVVTAIAFVPVTLSSVAAAEGRSLGTTPMACTTDAGPRVCVYAQDHLLLEDTTRQARRIITVLKGTPGAPTWAGPWPLGTDDPGMLTVRTAEIDPWGRVDTSYGVQPLVDAYALFAAAPACRDAILWQSDAGDAMPGEMGAFHERSSLLSWWLTDGIPPWLTSPDASDLNRRFAASTEDQRTDFAAAVRTAALACDVTAVKAADEHLPPMQR